MRRTPVRPIPGEFLPKKLTAHLAIRQTEPVFRIFGEGGGSCPSAMRYHEHVYISGPIGRLSSNGQR